MSGEDDPTEVEPIGLLGTRNTVPLLVSPADHPSTAQLPEGSPGLDAGSLRGLPPPEPLVVLGPLATPSTPTLTRQARSPSNSPSGPPPTTGGASGRSPPVTLAESTVAAMHGEEATRAAGFGRAVALLCIIGLLGQLGYAGHPLLRIAMAAAQSLLGAVATWVWWRARDPGRWSLRVFRIFGVTAALASVVFIHFLGVFSPISVVVVLGLSFFGRCDDGVFIFPVSIAVALAYMISALLVTFNITTDLGLFSPSGVPWPARLSILVMVTSTMLMQLWEARLGRRATREAIERSNEAVSAMRTREAQLEEAKEDLDAVIRAGAGRGGRYTGTVAGTFRLEHIVGRGAMGEVYSARAVEGDQRAAVKLLHIGKLDQPELVSRFLREAEVARRVRGPNLVNLLEVGSAHDGSPYIAMDLLEGKDLATVLRDRPSLSLAEVVTLVTDVARGLDVLHAAGIVHRDLKPANLFLSTGSGSKWMILDYGVSKLNESTLTDHQVVGTPGYMAPEQALGGNVDPRADTFALGAVAYRALTGRRPFTGTGSPQLLYQVVYAQPIGPRDIATSIPRDMELVLAIALAKRPEDRFQASSAFAAALRLASRGALDAPIRAHGERLLRAAPWSKNAA